MHPPEARKLALRLLASGLTVREIHRQTGIPRQTLYYWKKDPEKAAARVVPTCPHCHSRTLDGRPYSYVLGLYLGDGHIVRSRKPEVYRLEITCADSWPGLIEEAARALSEVMPGQAIGRRKSTGCTNVGAYSKHWPCLFPQHGPGLKHTRKIELVPWQQEITDEFTGDFLRGLIHSDGYRGMNRVKRPVNGEDRWYEYPRYSFSNRSMDIQRMFTDALDRLGIAWRQMNRWNVSVARREAVARLDEFVGPKY
ncbi:helix-turn-helix domain-containing protein [Actinomadura atramentaria]|uniref:helix-turn-helix domain-containing protein n=1 Tax=Actinomadura atramentaria TaxID=1990 RepID=UPI00035D3EA3|nr:helix-turn-helix domain-containing protein [Actinomadura atramentaria]